MIKYYEERECPYNLLVCCETAAHSWHAANGHSQADPPESAEPTAEPTNRANRATAHSLLHLARDTRHAQLVDTKRYYTSSQSATRSSLFVQITDCYGATRSSLALLADRKPTRATTHTQGVGVLWQRRRGGALPRGSPVVGIPVGRHPLHVCC